MDNDINYRRGLEEARKCVDKLECDGSEAALNAYWEVCCGDVLVAEENLSNQDREWENASLAVEFLDMANPLEGYDDMLDNLYLAVLRMKDAIVGHPRLKVKLLELERTIIHRIEALADHDLGASEEVENELSYYRCNIAYADKGDFDMIVQKGRLKQDPIEWSSEYEHVIDEANRKVYSLLEDHPRGMGFCLAYWSVKRQVLKEDYGIDWKSPAVMNPGVIFD